MKRFSCTLIISTYNWPAALELCLLSVKQQRILPDEVIICDDGSTNETLQLIENIRKDIPIPVIHVWQEDKGFKKSQILNKGLAKASYEYVIEIDGDIIMHPRFIEDHLRFAKRKTFVCGVRTMFTESITRYVIERKQVTGLQSFVSKSGKKYNGFRILPLAFLNYWLQRGKKQVLYAIGANIAFFKEDAYLVNGYNEAFTGWGKEDNEFALRLYNAGVDIRFIKFGAIAYHLYHKEESRGKMKENELVLNLTDKNNITFVPEGISQYLN